jgi:hypothetical protein
MWPRFIWLRTGPNDELLCRISGSIKSVGGGGIFDWLNDYQLLKDRAARSEPVSFVSTGEVT